MHVTTPGTPSPSFHCGSYTQQIPCCGQRPGFGSTRRDMETEAHVVAGAKAGGEGGAEREWKRREETMTAHRMLDEGSGLTGHWHSDLQYVSTHGQALDAAENKAELGRASRHHQIAQSRMLIKCAGAKRVQSLARHSRIRLKTKSHASCHAMKQARQCLLSGRSIMQIQGWVCQKQCQRVHCSSSKGKEKEGRSTMDGLGPSRAYLASPAEAGPLNTELMQWG